jgi:hypothetical protein
MGKKKKRQLGDRVYSTSSIPSKGKLKEQEESAQVSEASQTSLTNNTDAASSTSNSNLIFGAGTEKSSAVPTPVLLPELLSARPGSADWEALSLQTTNSTARAHQCHLDPRIRPHVVLSQDSEQAVVNFFLKHWTHLVPAVNSVPATEEAWVRGLNWAYMELCNQRFHPDLIERAILDVHIGVCDGTTVLMALAEWLSIHVPHNELPDGWVKQLTLITA